MLSLSRNCSLVLLVAYFLAQASNTSALNLTDVDIECLMLKGLDACYSAAYTSQTRDQQCFTISEVTADWREPMVPQRIMWPSIAHADGQLDARCS